MPLAVVAKGMLKAIGIDVTIKAEPSSVYYNTDWLQAPLTVTDWGHRPAPSQLLNLAYRTGGIWNASHWHNRTFDSLVLTFDATLDFSTRKALGKRIERLMTTETPALIPFFTKSPTFVRGNVRGFTPDTIGFNSLTYTTNG